MGPVLAGRPALLKIPRSPRSRPSKPLLKTDASTCSVPRGPSEVPSQGYTLPRIFNGLDTARERKVPAIKKLKSLRGRSHLRGWWIDQVAQGLISATIEQ